MSGLTSDQLLLLEMVSRFTGTANWYQVGRAALGKLSNPGRFSEALRWLLDNGYLSEHEQPEQTLPSLHLTAVGRQVLAKHTER